MTFMNWVSIAFGVVFIAMGVAFFASRTFGDIAFQMTSQGNLWKSLLGEKWAPVFAKFFLSLVSIAFGGWIIYSVISGTN